MTRRDFGFVVSRALALWAVMLSLQNGTYLLLGLPPGESYGFREIAIAGGVAGMTLGTAWLLWFRADVFAGTLSEEPARVTFTSADLFEALAATVGLYYFLSGLIHLLSVAMYGLLREEADLGSSWVAPALEVIAGLVVVLWTSPRARRALSNFWRVEDPEDSDPVS